METKFYGKKGAVVSSFILIVLIIIGRSSLSERPLEFFDLIFLTIWGYSSYLIYQSYLEITSNYISGPSSGWKNLLLGKRNKIYIEDIDLSKSFRGFLNRFEEDKIVSIQGKEIAIERTSITKKQYLKIKEKIVGTMK